MNNSNPTKRKAHKILKKITKKLGKQDLYYSAQFGIDSSKEATFNTWAAYIASPRDGLAPVTFVSFSKEDFIQKLEDFYKDKISPEQVEVAFHEGQIESNNRSNEYHKEQIDAILNPKGDETEATPEEDGATNTTETPVEPDVVDEKAAVSQD